MIQRDNREYFREFVLKYFYLWYGLKYQGRGKKELQNEKVIGLWRDKYIRV